MNYFHPDFYSGQFYGPGLYKLFRQETENRMAGIPDVMAEEKRAFEDSRRLQSFYPEMAREIQHFVEEECDKLEYEGSMMFDEYPDPVMMHRMVTMIGERVKAQLPEEEYPVEEPLEEVLTMQSPKKKKAPRRNWLEDLIKVMLVDEMHRRRCRHRRCGRRYW